MANVGSAQSDGVTKGPRHNPPFVAASSETDTGSSHSSATVGDDGIHVMSMSSPSLTTRASAGMVSDSSGYIWKVL